MMRVLAPLAIALLAIAPVSATAAPDAGNEVARVEITGRLEKRGDIQILTLWGSPRDRGFAHGYLLAGSTVDGIDMDLRRLLGARAKARLAMVGPMVGRAFAFSKDEETEMRGILEGIRARLPAEKRSIPLLEREIDLEIIKLLNTLGDWYALGCSSAAMWGSRTDDGTATVVRNFDFPALSVLVSPSHVRVVAPTEGETRRRGWVGVGHPGGIGTLTAMNEEGVFVAIHDVGVRPGMQDLTQPNVPRLVALRRLMERLAAKGACEAARDLLRTWPTLYGNNFMLATPVPGEGLPAAILEYDTRERMNGGVDLRGPDPAPEGRREFVVCSNHHRVRASGRCRRYDDLVTGCRQDPPEGGFSTEDLFALADRAAVPRGDRRVGVGGFGTLHQAVARTGVRKLWLRFLEPGSHIREAKPALYDVPALVKAAASEAK